MAPASFFPSLNGRLFDPTYPFLCCVPLFGTQQQLHCSVAEVGGLVGTMIPLALVLGVRAGYLGLTKLKHIILYI